jgi:hypothetical protein
MTALVRAAVSGLGSGEVVIFHQGLTSIERRRRLGRGRLRTGPGRRGEFDRHRRGREAAGRLRARHLLRLETAARDPPGSEDRYEQSHEPRPVGSAVLGRVNTRSLASGSISPMARGVRFEAFGWPRAVAAIRRAGRFGAGDLRSPVGLRVGRALTGSCLKRWPRSTGTAVFCAVAVCGGVRSETGPRGWRKVCR